MSGAEGVDGPALVARPNVINFRGVDVTLAEIGGDTVFFATDMKRDPIQRAHRHGQFFEAKELRLLEDLFPQGGTFVDIGANVGNHTLYAALKLKAARVIPFEPNPKVARLLAANVALNRLSGIVDLSHVGFGLGDVDSDSFGLEARAVNLGATKMLPDQGTVKVRRGDDVLAGEKIDLMKVDVEGMEMAVLRGLEQVIATNRPNIMIEVPREHETDFRPWLEAHNYRIVHALPHYKVLTNYILAATEK
jgi:FkbM family methyltransferase